MASLPVASSAAKIPTTQIMAEAAVADLLVAHLVVVHLDAEGVAEVARLPARVLPPRQLHDRRHGQEHQHRARDALGAVQRAKAGRCRVEAREAQPMLAKQA